MKKKVSMLLVCLTSAVFISGAPVDKLHFRLMGFSISPLESDPGNNTYQALTMYLPSSEGFSPNVGVQTQPFEGSVKAYAALSEKQFQQMNIKLLKEKEVGTNQLVVEYAGALQSHSLHWYARAVLKNGRAYLVTATSTERQWSSMGAKLENCVDSFELEKGN